MGGGSQITRACSANSPRQPFRIFTIPLPIAELLQGSTLDPVSWLYGNQSPSQELARTLHFVVAADTYLTSDVSLVMTIQADTCKMESKGLPVSP